MGTSCSGKLEMKVMVLGVNYTGSSEGGKKEIV